MTEDPPVAITLTDAQVAAIVSEAASTAGIATLLSEATDMKVIRERLRSLATDQSYSLSTVRALLILSACSDDREHEVAELAKELDLTASTVHRYLATWVAVGLLHRNPHTRKYRRPPWLPPAAGSSGDGAPRKRGR